MGLAQGVTYAVEINEASKIHGILPELLQSMISVADDPNNLTALPVGAEGYAQSYARTAGLQTLNPVGEPLSNIVAAAWWLRVMCDVVGDQWAAVTEYFGGGPRGQAAMRRIYYTELPKWTRNFA